MTRPETGPDRRRVLAALAAAPLAWPAARAADSAADRPVESAAAVTLPRWPLRQWRLANGLQVFALPLAGAAMATVQVWYRVGGKDDPPRRSGFAHLFEHIMFKRTRHLGDEAFDRLTEDVGGANNAFTADDVTAYQNEIPPNHVERLLWAEAERMANLRVTQATFDSEREVVKEELRERVLADPYGRLFNAVPTYGYLRHPYRRSPIGNIADLDAATLADVRSFHATYYRPDNAALIVAGDVDPGTLERWVGRYFGGLARPRRPVPRVRVREPRRRASRRVELHAPTVPLPALALLWQGVAADHADAPALRVAAALLSAGESSRLNESLVYRQRLAQSAGFASDTNAEAGLLVGYAIAAGGRPLAASEQALRGEIERLARDPIAAAELDKVSAQLLTAKVAERQTPAGMADALGWALTLHGRAEEAERELERLQAVQVADVQRVLRAHVLQRPSVTIHYSQRQRAGAPAASAPLR